MVVQPGQVFSPIKNSTNKHNDSWTEKNLIISIMPRNADEMKIAYHFTEKQNSDVNELLEQRQMLMQMVGDLNTVSADTKEALRNLPDDLSPERR